MTGITVSYKGYKGLHGVTKSDRGLQKITVGYNGLKEDTRGYRRLEGITDTLFPK